LIGEGRDARLPRIHPLRKIRALVRDVLGEMSSGFSSLYAKEYRPSIGSFWFILSYVGNRTTVLDVLFYNVLRKPWRQ